MTEDRYRWWCGEIAKAKAENEGERVSSLQLDYNLELGECLSHQSQRTKDILSDLGEVKDELEDVSVSVGQLGGRMQTMEANVSKMAESVSTLAASVNDLLTYRRDAVMKVAGARTLWGTLIKAACGIALVVGWGYAIYQALYSH